MKVLVATVRNENFYQNHPYQIEGKLMMNRSSKMMTNYYTPGKKLRVNPPTLVERLVEVTDLFMVDAYLGQYLPKPEIGGKIYINDILVGKNKVQLEVNINNEDYVFDYYFIKTNGCFGFYYFDKPFNSWESNKIYRAVGNYCNYNEVTTILELF